MRTVLLHSNTPLRLDFAFNLESLAFLVFTNSMLLIHDLCPSELLRIHEILSDALLLFP